MTQLRDSFALQLKQYKAVLEPVIIRCEIPVPSPDILKWLTRQVAGDRFYWKSRDSAFEIAGTGKALLLPKKTEDSLHALFDYVRNLLSKSSSGVKFFCTMPFDETMPLSDEWRDFGAYHVFVPRFELVKRDNACFFCVNHFLDGCRNEAAIIDQIVELFGKLNFNDDNTAVSEKIPVIRSITFEPDDKTWKKNVRDVVGCFDATFKKVVLARKASVQLLRNLDAAALFTTIANNNTRTFTYFIEQGSSAFLGASPEMLYARTGSAISTEAIAGTYCQSSGDTADAASVLLHSSKESAEHDYVVQDIVSVLGKICKTFDVSKKRDVVIVNRLGHLRKSLAGILLNDVFDSKILMAMHPTAALLGFPREKAKGFLKQYELFSRGFYGAPVGWIGKEDAEFAVAIRSALVAGDNLFLYAGAGIVQGSDPEHELLEIENKMRQYLEYIQYKK
jgi:menaquinone-specific isochorismate synthase